MPGRFLSRCALVITTGCVLVAQPVFGQTPPAVDGITRLVAQIQDALAAGQPERYLQLLTPEADRDAAQFALAALIQPRPVRAVVREQDREALNLAKTRIIIEIFIDLGVQAKLSTWRIDLRRSTTDIDGWLVCDQEVLTTLNGLFKLSLSPSEVYSARGLSIEDEDFRLQMADGSAFVMQAAGRITGLVLVGRGDLTFRPAPATERGQMRIFAGAEEMQTPIEAAFVRVNPEQLAERVHGLGEKIADQRDVKRADEVFREHNGRAFSLDLGDLSPDVWSLMPQAGNLLAEVYTRRFGMLTYSRSQEDPEDISLFDRKARRNIAHYASRARLAARGPFYDEDTLADYDVIDYDLDAMIDPERRAITGRARMTMVVRADNVATLTIRLSEGLKVRAASAETMGRLFAFRVHGRNSVVLTLPALVVRGTRLALTLDYGGVLDAQAVDVESVAVAAGQDPDLLDVSPPMPIERSWVYSTRSYWYPQSTMSDYTTAMLRITVPARFAVVASGERVAAVPGDRGIAGDATAVERAGLKRFVFRAARPVRYFACAITPLVDITHERIALDEPSRDAASSPALQGRSIDLTVRAQSRQKNAARTLAALAADVVRFYGQLLGDCPYPTLDLALLEQRMPGGHSPAYVGLINYPVPIPGGSGSSWRNDPAILDGFKEYFVAHEIAHQWWGQAVGWKNYHEQWLSEGFAQYFAALYAEHLRGPGLFQDILRRWQRWAVDKSDQGPVYLGYRVGHIRGDSRVFRAVVYNKSAMVLHMLRRVLGDDAFFRGLRRFYRNFRYRKAGTDDLQHALEGEAGTSLQQFFDCWIYGDTLPRVRATTYTDLSGGHQDVVVMMEQSGQVFDMPVAVTLDYADRPPVDVTVRLKQAQQEFRIPLAGSLRRVDLNRVDAVPFSDFAVSAPLVAPPPSRQQARR